MNAHVLREAGPEHNLAIRALILRILNEEYAMALTLAELPDLVDVYDTYRVSGGGNFWIAEEDGRVIGCIGLMRLDGADFELRRMYVEARARGRGLAQGLLDVLFGWAARHGVEALYLETNEQWHAAHHIYEKNGFVPVTQAELPPGFPIVRVATGFYRLRLPSPVFPEKGPA
jgi:N-acetylglutamate synthase-like GNAT family acetyltransferase